MLKIKMAMMLHTFENTMDSRLGSFVMTAVKLVPVENFYLFTKIQRPRNGPNLMCLT